MADFREIAARVRRFGKTVTAVAKLLGSVGLGVFSVVAFLRPVHFSPTETPSCPVWFVEYVAQYTGLSSQTAAMVMVRLFWAGMIAGAVYLGKETLEEWEFGWKALVWPLTVGVAIIGLYAAVIVGLPELMPIRPPAAAQYAAPRVPLYRLTTPPTLYNLGVIIIVVVWLFITSGRVLRYDPETLNVLRVSEGLGGLAVVALCLHNAALDVGGFGNLLAWFTQAVPGFLRSPKDSPVELLSLAALFLVTIMSALRLAVGLRGPFFLRQKTMLLAKQFGWLDGKASRSALTGRISGAPIRFPTTQEATVAAMPRR